MSFELPQGTIKLPWLHFKSFERPSSDGNRIGFIIKAGSLWSFAKCHMCLEVQIHSSLYLTHIYGLFKKAKHIPLKPYYCCVCYTSLQLCNKRNINTYEIAFARELSEFFFKWIVYQKWIFCHHLFSLISFQIRMTYFSVEH